MVFARTEKVNGKIKSGLVEKTREKNKSDKIGSYAYDIGWTYALKQKEDTAKFVIIKIQSDFNYQLNPTSCK